VEASVFLPELFYFPNAVLPENEKAVSGNLKTVSKPR
jgi:hypothetical protein